MTAPAESTQSEFSRPVAVATLEPGETVIDIDADAEERSALAGRFGLLGLDGLRATVHLMPVEGAEEVRVWGALEAEIRQRCVITLQPVEQSLSVTFERLYSGDPAHFAPVHEVVLSLEDEDLPEPIVDGTVDIGEAVAEEMALNLDPFPRAADASFEGYAAEPGDGAGAPGGPFAELAKLKGDGE